VGQCVSDSLIPISDEQAKLGQELVKALRDLGSFFGKALGNTPENLVGYLFGDRLQIRRAENFIRLLGEAQKRLGEWAVPEPKAATLSVLLPILRGGAEEDREELVDLWARLLANAMDPKLNTVRHQFISAVQAMDPPDARTMNYLYRARVQRIRVGGGGDQSDSSIEYAAKQLGVRQDDLEVSIRHLEVLDFLSTGSNDKTVWFPNAKMREFMRACYPELET
jgi:hypothetical protein